MLINNFHIRQLKESLWLITSNELGLFQIISKPLGLSLSKVKQIFLKSNDYTFSIDDFGSDEQRKNILNILKEHHIDSDRYPKISPFNNDDWRENLKKIGSKNLISEIEALKIRIDLPQFVKDIFLLYEDQSKVFDFCSLIYNIAQDLEIAPEDKKMIFNTFYLKLTESIEENKKYLKSPSSDKKYIADSIKILNDVYTSIEKELPKTGIFNYINLSDRKFEQPKQNNFILNKDYKLDASAFCGRLKKANFIDNKTKEASLKNLFSQDNKSTVIWIGHKNALYYLIKSIKEKGIIENRHYKNIVNQIFTNSNKDSIKLPNGSLKEKDLPTSYIIQEIEKIISSSFIKKNN